MYLDSTERDKLLETRLKNDPAAAIASRKIKAGTTTEHTNELDIMDQFLQIYLLDGIVLRAVAISKNRKQIFVLGPDIARWVSIKTVLYHTEQRWPDPRVNTDKQ